MDLSNKNVIIVGGTGGIGYATCKQLLSKDIASLTVLDKVVRNKDIEALKAINRKVNLQAFEYDVTMDLSAMKAKFKGIMSHIERIDLLINGAGICNDHLVEQTIQINLLGLINTTIAAFDYMDKRNGGSGGLILNIASAAGLNSHPFVCVYSATKAGVISFTTSLAKLHNLTGIESFAICPGATKTPIANDVKTFLDVDENINERISRAPEVAFQAPEVCAKGIVSTIETYKNDGIYIVDYGNIINVEWPTFWTPVKELM